MIIKVGININIDLKYFKLGKEILFITSFTEDINNFILKAIVDINSLIITKINLYSNISKIGNINISKIFQELVGLTINEGIDEMILEIEERGGAFTIVNFMLINIQLLIQHEILKLKCIL